MTLIDTAPLHDEEGRHPPSENWKCLNLFFGPWVAFIPYDSFLNVVAQIQGGDHRLREVEQLRMKESNE